MPTTTKALFVTATLSRADTKEPLAIDGARLEAGNALRLPTTKLQLQPQSGDANSPLRIFWNAGADLVRGTVVPGQTFSHQVDDKILTIQTRALPAGASGKKAERRAHKQVRAAREDMLENRARERQRQRITTTLELMKDELHGAMHDLYKAAAPYVDKDLPVVGPMAHPLLDRAIKQIRGAYAELEARAKVALTRPEIRARDFDAFFEQRRTSAAAIDAAASEVQSLGAVAAAGRRAAQLAEVISATITRTSRVQDPLWQPVIEQAALEARTAVDAAVVEVAGRGTQPLERGPLPADVLERADALPHVLRDIVRELNDVVRAAEKARALRQTAYERLAGARASAKRSPHRQLLEKFLTAARQEVDTAEAGFVKLVAKRLGGTDGRKLTLEVEDVLRPKLETAVDWFIATPTAGLYTGSMEALLRRWDRLMSIHAARVSRLEARFRNYFDDSGERAAAMRSLRTFEGATRRLEIAIRRRLRTLEHAKLGSLKAAELFRFVDRSTRIVEGRWEKLRERVGESRASQPAVAQPQAPAVYQQPMYQQPVYRPAPPPGYYGNNGVYWR